MNWTKKNLAFRVILINISVLVLIWFFLEVGNYFANPFNKISHRVQCYYDWIFYNYCPNITDVQRNTRDDGGEVIFTYTNNIGQRVGKLKGDSELNPDNVYIGDSFIQADEMDFDSTFYGRLRKSGYRVAALGYSSWNIIEYREAIEKLSVRGTHYHVFLMPNDINPLYYRSVYAERRADIKRKLDIEIPSGLFSEFRSAYSNSLFKKLILIIKSLPKSRQEKTINLLKSDGFTSERVDDCSPLKKLEEEYKSKLSFDYLVYSKNPICWDEMRAAAAHEALAELEKLVNSVGELNSNLTVYMIPPGWSFSQQNTNGRKADYYSFDDSLIVTTEPLLNFFAHSMPNVNFINLEKLIGGWVDKCGDCKNEFYFSDDGHWTPETHRRLAEYFSKSLNSSR